MLSPFIYAGKFSSMIFYKVQFSPHSLFKIKSPSIIQNKMQTNEKEFTLKQFTFVYFDTVQFENHYKGEIGSLYVIF